MSLLVKKLQIGDAGAMSASPPTAVEWTNRRECRNGPSSDSCTATKDSYSITWSARSKMETGMLMPSAVAVSRLTTDLNLVGYSIGMSPGFVPFRILSTK